MICSIILKVAQQNTRDRHFVTKQKSTARTQRVKHIQCTMYIVYTSSKIVYTVFKRLLARSQ